MLPLNGGCKISVLWLRHHPSSAKAGACPSLQEKSSLIESSSSDLTICSAFSCLPPTRMPISSSQEGMGAGQGKVCSEVILWP